MCISIYVCVCLCVLQFSLRVFSTFDFTWQSHGFSRQIHFCCTGFFSFYLLLLCFWLSRKNLVGSSVVSVAKQVTTCCPTAFNVVYALLHLHCCCCCCCWFLGRHLWPAQPKKSSSTTSKCRSSLSQLTNLSCSCSCSYLCCSCCCRAEAGFN